jgi:hypothetical protein
MLSIASLLLSVTFALAPLAATAPLSATAALDSPQRHVRTTDKSVRHLLKRGYTRSRTFARLLARLDRSNVIVYIEQVPRLPGALDGRMMMLPEAHGVRYVRIQIALRGSPDDSVALLGHELQHATEIAEALEVKDEAGLVKLYQRIGVRGGQHVYDTLAAQEMGRMVRKELVA